MLLAKGYPDIGWNPCGGEKYLDFLRFAVFVNGMVLNLLQIAICKSNGHIVSVYIIDIIIILLRLTMCFPSLPVGESVEENANVVVRLLIRRPECFGPALRGEGGNGLLAAIEEAIKISEDPARDGPSVKKDRRFPM